MEDTKFNKKAGRLVNTNTYITFSLYGLVPVPVKRTVIVLIIFFFRFMDELT